MGTSSPESKVIASPESWFPVQAPLLLTDSPHSCCGVCQRLVSSGDKTLVSLLVLCQASNSTLGRFSLSQGSSLLNTLLWIKSGSNFPLLSRLFQLAFQASGNTGPAFCPEALLPQQRKVAFSLGGNQHLKGKSSEIST